MFASNTRRRLSRRILVVALAVAVPGLGLACVRRFEEKTVTKSSGGETSVTRSKTSVSRLNGGTYQVSIEVDDHPKISRNFQTDVDVEVNADMSGPDGVSRTVVTIKKKQGGQVLEVITL